MSLLQLLDLLARLQEKTGAYACIEPGQNRSLVFRLTWKEGDDVAYIKQEYDLFSLEGYPDAAEWVYRTVMKKYNDFRENKRSARSGGSSDERLNK